MGPHSTDYRNQQIPLQDEFHSRLKFVRRGLVAMANGGPNDNGSQFFFTLDKTPDLQGKHTIFGKVRVFYPTYPLSFGLTVRTLMAFVRLLYFHNEPYMASLQVVGNTLYNMLKLGECQVDKNERPLDPHRIFKTEVRIFPSPSNVAMPILNSSLPALSGSQ